MKSENWMPMGLCLGAEQLYEILCDNAVGAELGRKNENTGIVGVQYYLGQETDCSRYCYLCTPQMLAENPLLDPAAVLIVLGLPPEGSVSPKSALITVSETENTYKLLNTLSGEFIRYAVLDKRLSEAVTNGGLDEIGRIALEHFNNPVFIHDEYYNILACPQFVEGVTNFTYNERTRHYMQSVETINSFKLSPAYRDTMATRGGQLWDNDLATNEIAIYANLWINDVYKGRLVIPTVFTPLRPRQLFEATFFAEAIQNALLRSFMEGDGGVNPLKSFIIDAVDGSDIDKTLLEERIASHDWNPEDLYLCAVISLYSEAVTQLSVFAMCNYIENHIPGSWVCFYKNAIYLIANCTKGDIGPSDLRMLMSSIIRESMLNMGVSNVFQNIASFPQYIKQARIALEYGQKKPAAIWYNEFRSCVLEYWLTKGLGEFDRETISASALAILRSYDEKHGSNLYQTLKIYLYYERNSTVTAKLLKLHRSTLPYRLERIAQLTRLNLDDHATRLYLNMSFAIMEEA